MLGELRSSRLTTHLVSHESVFPWLVSTMVWKDVRRRGEALYVPEIENVIGLRSTARRVRVS